MYDSILYYSSSTVYHWLRIITRLSGYVIENLTWILYTIFYNVSGESGYDSNSKPVILPVLVITLIPVIHWTMHLMIFSIYGLYPSSLIIIILHNSNCDNRNILLYIHLLLLSVSITTYSYSNVKTGQGGA
jgi:hypothetical protein